MNEIDELKRKRFEQLRRLQEAQAEQQQVQNEQYQQDQNQIAQLEDFIRQYLTKDALSRYGNLKIAHPEKAVQVLVLLSQAIQSRKIKVIDDATLKSVLQKLSPEKKEFRIRKV